jgi:molybdopterin-guanine dinucleotide biosynthesis protein A
MIAIILAGGKSSRMGNQIEEKELIESIPVLKL